MDAEKMLTPSSKSGEVEHSAIQRNQRDTPSSPEDGTMPSAHTSTPSAEHDDDEEDDDELQEDSEEASEEDSEEDSEAAYEAREKKRQEVGDERDRLLSTISQQLSSHEKKDVFAIGGYVSLPKDKPIKIRWGSSMGQDTGRLCELPIADDPERQEAFTKLIHDCQPATFGLGNKDVLDEEYRKAGKMDSEEFCSSFNLAEHSIMDTITQALVQSVWSKKEMNGVRAELYKLNIYSAPSGKFKKHVDTPRSGEQMGSLVICLPVVHQGGALMVRHGGQEVAFNWSMGNPHENVIQWAAMFSDCEHEVLEVTSGHRVTLTYNLYWTECGGGRMAKTSSCLEPEILPFYKTLEELFDCEEFLRNGGLIGFKCTHGYPHTSRSAVKNQIAPTLKGLDMVVYQALKDFAIDIDVCAVMKKDQYFEDYYEEDEEESYYEEERDYTRKSTTMMSWGAKEVMTDHGGIHEWMGPVGWRGFKRDKVTWLNGSPKKFDELQVATVVYGNEGGELMTYYTAAAIVARIQGFEERCGII